MWISKTTEHAIWVAHALRYAVILAIARFVSSFVVGMIQSGCRNIDGILVREDHKSCIGYSG
jgi:hypothetical protein